METNKDIKKPLQEHLIEDLAETIENKEHTVKMKIRDFLSVIRVNYFGPKTKLEGSIRFRLPNGSTLTFTLNLSLIHI